ncbi:MAG: hypothetical protein H6585_10105 [Flavobacteriales bacterium]|nr:hypothetical protein [Flavobacteriales bacterium]
MSTNKKGRYSHNRIDYIVFGDPKAARKLVHDYGYIPPKDLHDLSDTVKQLVKKRGEVFIKDLLKIHPDRKAVLMADKDTEQDEFCGGCGHASSYTGDLKDLSRKELEDLYAETKDKLSDSPEGDSLKKKLGEIWDVLSDKKKEDEKKDTLSVKKEWAWATIALVVGIIIGSAGSGSKSS